MEDNLKSGSPIVIGARRVTDWSEVLDSARYTVHKVDLGKEPSKAFKYSMLMSEHSPIRMLQYVVTMSEVPCWVSQHIARHDAFACHQVREGASETHFVATSRTDRTGIPRNKMPQDAPVGHRIFLNAQDLINISERRLCRLASPETRGVWLRVKEAIGEIDPEMRDVMRPTCVYRGFCPERECCGYANTEAFRKEVEEYRNLIGRK